MKRSNRIISALVLVCFLFNIALSDLAYGLAPASSFSTLKDIEHKDIGRIKISVELKLKQILKDHPPLDRVNFLEYLKKRLGLVHDKENTIFEPAGIQLFFHETTPLVSDWYYVQCRIVDAKGLTPFKEIRTYYAVFSPYIDKDGGYPLEIWTKHEFDGVKEAIERSGIMPRRNIEKPEDAKAIDKYVQQEKGIDTVIRYAHEHNLPIRISFDNPLFSYTLTVQHLIKYLNLVSDDTASLQLLAARKCYIIPITLEIDKMLKESVITIIAEDGTVKKQIPYAHSSNNAVHIFLNEDEIKTLKNGEYYKGASIADRLMKTVAHEIGVMLGCPILKFEYGMPINEIDIRYRNYLLAKPLASKRYSVANLDTNLLTRDYATSENATFVPSIPVINAFRYMASIALRQSLKDSPKALKLAETVLSAFTDTTVIERKEDYRRSVAKLVAELDPLPAIPFRSAQFWNPMMASKIPAGIANFLKN